MGDTAGSVDGLVPYGFMPDDYEKDAAANAVPAGWPGGEASWHHWTASLVRDLVTIWPEFKPGGWAGKTQASLQGLTLEELSLIEAFASEHLDKPMSAPDGPVPPPVHLALFREEDQRLMPERTLRKYHTGIGDGLVNHWAYVTTVALKDRSDIVLATKRLFQRPRPQNAARLLGRSAFRHHIAFTAQHPAFISGHAFQSLFSGAAILDDIRYHRTGLGHFEPLVKRWMTDVGDRRVMAGVHYPTDNIGSWIAALRFADALFPAIFRESYRPELEESIRQSMLYRFLEPRAAGLPYLSAAWKLLQAELAASAKA